MSWRRNWGTTYTPTCREGKQVCAQREIHLIAEGAFMLVGEPQAASLHAAGEGGDGAMRIQGKESSQRSSEFGLSGRI